MNKTRLLFFSFFFTDGGRNLPGYTGLGLASIQLAEPRTILPFLDIKMKKNAIIFWFMLMENSSLLLPCNEFDMTDRTLYTFIIIIHFYLVWKRRWLWGNHIHFRQEKVACTCSSIPESRHNK